MNTSLFEVSTGGLTSTEQFVRKAVEAVIPTGEKLPATKSFELWTVLPVDTNLGTGQMFIPGTVFLVYLLDVGFSCLPLLYSVGNAPDDLQVYSARN